VGGSDHGWPRPSVFLPSQSVPETYRIVGFKHSIPQPAHSRPQFAHPLRLQHPSLVGAQPVLYCACAVCAVLHPGRPPLNSLLNLASSGSESTVASKLSVRNCTRQQTMPPLSLTSTSHRPMPQYSTAQHSTVHIQDAQKPATLGLVPVCGKTKAETLREVSAKPEAQHRLLA
jgi:hypothetical protein